jgi:inositol transport system substrate-binding protein
VFQNAKAQGSGSVDLALKMAKGDKSAAPNVMIPFELVTQDNYKQYSSN